MNFNFLNEYTFIDYYSNIEKTINISYDVIDEKNIEFIKKTDELLENIKEMKEFISHVRSD